ncbi:MAG: ORC1-type DNA replication protein [Candidatus Aenigmarchaeota archaeon]|nr:ORC1-type DNA replication protein [Candidatus Aenigmarchaeota archaeon]
MVVKNNIFSEYLEKETIFKNKNVLTASFMPSNIPHRENEINQLSSIIAPALRGYHPNNIFIYGTCGTGKSLSIRFVLNQLEDISRANGSEVKTIYINCKMKKVADTEYRLFAQLLQEMGVHVPDTGLPTDVLYRNFFEKIDEKKRVVIIALDEIDSLFKKVGDEFLYNLTRVNGELKRAQLSIVGITNDLSFLNNLDMRVKSSLGEEEILFKPYNAMQLKDILQNRIKEGFNEGIVEEGVINKCAALAAQEHGDARRALDLLRVAGEITERLGDPKIEEKHVDIAEEKIDMDRVVETVKSQPRQSQAVLYSVLKLSNNGHTRVLTGDVFDEYIKVCANNSIKSLTQRRVSDLIGELDMLGVITARVISKGRYGRTRDISLAISDSVLEKVEGILRTRFGD